MRDQGGLHRVVVLVMVSATLAGSACGRSQGHTIQTADGQLYYRVRGAGSAVVLLSGGPGHTGEYMSPLFDRAAASRKAILPDLRGTGRSRLARLDSTTITLDRAVADLEAIRRHQDVERWTLVGHSWGGVLAMAYAAAHPERVSGLVLIGTGSASLAAMSAASGRLRERLTQADIDSIRFWASRARDSRDSAQAQIEMKRIGWNAYIYDRVKLPAVSAWLSPETYSATVSELMWRDLRSPPYDLRRELLVLREDSVPVYLIGGVADEIALAAHAELEVLFPWAAVRMVPRSGHFPWVEASEHFFRYFDEAISVTRE